MPAFLSPVTILDTNLTRLSANILKTDDTFLVGGATSTGVGGGGAQGGSIASTGTVGVFRSTVGNNSFLTGLITDTAQYRFAITADGTMSWGDGAVTRDVNLYRSAADTLKTDDAFIVGGASISIGTTPATSGALRLPNAQYIYWRNSANTADNFGIKYDSGISFYDNTFATGYHEFRTGPTPSMALRIGVSQIDLGVSLVGAYIGGTIVAASNYLTVGTNPATSGALRLANAGTISWRNAANSADVATLWNEGSGITILNATTGNYIGLRINNTSVMYLDSAKLNVEEGKNIAFGTTTGTKIGTTTTQKLSFWNVTPIVQPANTVAIDDVLVNTGLRATGGVSNFTTALSSTTITLTGTAPQISLNNATSMWIQWASSAAAPPAFTTRSTGTKLVLWPAVDATHVDFAVGIESNAVWQSVQDTTASFKWYGGTTLVATLTGTGNLTMPGALQAQKLLVLDGQSSVTYTSQSIVLGYSGTAQYQNRIGTRHNAGGQQSNAIDFYTWSYGVDAVGTVGTKHVMTLDGNGRVGLNGLVAPTAALSLVSGTTAVDGIAFGTDVNLYRSAADTLKTDDNLYVAGNLTTPLALQAGTVQSLGPMYIPNGTYMYGRNVANSAWLGMIVKAVDNNTYVVSQSGGFASLGQEAGAEWFKASAAGSSVYGSYLTVGTTPAASGALRLANNQSIIWRNAANSGDIAAISIKADNSLVLDSGSFGELKTSTTAVAYWDTNNFGLQDGKNFIFPTTTGNKIGTATTQKIGFWNATPIVQPANTVAINDVLVNTGLRATGGVSNFTTDLQTTRVGIGGAPSSDRLLHVVGTYGNWSTTYAAVIAPTVAATSTTTSYGLWMQIGTVAASFTVAEIYGARILTPTVGSGSTITTYTGLSVDGSFVATNNYGVNIGVASTQTLWVGSNSNATTAAGGIAFGSSRDTNLYRIAANMLKTDSYLHVAKTASIGGVAPSVDFMFRVQGWTDPGSTFKYGQYLAPTFDSTTTNTANGLFVIVATAPAAFTLSELYGIRVFDATKGAGSTISNLFGLIVEPQTQGAANYGVRVGAASTQTLQIAYDANYTTAAAGIAFGISRDTNLYRSAADTLKTDDSFIVGGGLTVTGAFTWGGALTLSNAAPQISLSNGTSNWITWGSIAAAPPSFTTRSVGTKLVLYDALAAGATDYAIGIDSGTIWNSVPSTSGAFKWYGGTTLAATLTGTGALSLTAGLTAATVASGLTNLTQTSAGGPFAQLGVLRLKNSNTTVNNSTDIEFDSANGGVAAGIGATNLDHTNNYASLGFYTRAASGWAQRMRIDDTGLQVNSSFLSVGTNPAASGALRLANNQSVMWRTADNGADAGGIVADSANNINVNNQWGTVIDLQFGGTRQVRVGSTGYLAIGTNPATAGTIRLPDAGSVQARNGANTADMTLFTSTAGALYAGVPFNMNSNSLTNAGYLNTTGYITVGTNPATTGALRLANEGSIVARNAANSADYRLMRITSANRLVINPDVAAMDLGGDIYLTPGYTFFGGGAITVGVNPATGGHLRLPTDANIAMRNAANNANLNLLYANDLYTYLYAGNTFQIVAGGVTIGSWNNTGLAVNSSFLSVGTNPAQSGALRLANNGYITWRNVANNADSGHMRYSNADYFLFESSGGYVFQQSGVTSAAIGSSYLSIGATPSTTGTVRLPNVFQVSARNGANSLDKTILWSDGSNTFLDCQSGSSLVFAVNGSNKVQIQSGAMVCDIPISAGVNSSTTGAVRMPNNVWVAARNAANSADINALKVGSDNFTWLENPTALVFSIAGSSRLSLQTNLLTFTEAVDIVTGTTTGTKIGTATGQKIGFWNATPIVQPATGGASATVTGGGIANVNADTSFFDGYSISQIVKALRNVGILA